MKRIAHIENGVVVNISKGADNYVLGPDEVFSETANIGDAYASGVFTPSTIISKAELLLYLDYKYQRLANTEIAVDVNSGTALADTNDAGRVDINGLITMGMLGEALPQWHQSTGSLTVTLDDLKLIGLAVAAYRSAAVAVYSNAVAEINAGTITTREEIDVLAWP